MLTIVASKSQVCYGNLWKSSVVMGMGLRKWFEKMFKTPEAQTAVFIVTLKREPALVGQKGMPVSL